MTRASGLAVLAALAACTVEHEVLQDPVGVVTTCEDAWLVGVLGAPCAFEGSCDQLTPSDPMCCTDYAYCSTDGLVIATSCDPTCACTIDEECAFGAAICENQWCQACPATDVCAECPPGWLPLTRNGCPTCACAPPSECEGPGASCDANGAGGELCYGGASCADGCDATQPGCCSNACSPPGCVEPAPVGCLMACAPDQGCQICAAEACECDGVTWQCTPTCVDDLRVSCVVP